MVTRAILVAAICTACAGCTHRQLSRSTVLTTSTVTDIQYRIVLMNLAMLSCHPEALPSHIDLAEGVVQVNDETGFGGAGGLSTFSDGGMGLESVGPSASRRVSEQWGADATTDPRRLIDLRDLYRATLGLPPLPTLRAVEYLKKAEAEKARRNSDDNGDDGSSDDGSSGDGLSDSTERVPIEILLSDVPPPGWYGLGAKQDIPEDACYVGQYGDRYAWVTPHGIADMARFTLTVLLVVKLDPEKGGGPGRGLAVTR